MDSYLLCLPPDIPVDTQGCSVTDPAFETPEAYQPGDLLIGGMASQLVFFSQEYSFTEYPREEFSDYIIMVTKLYQHILSLVFALKQINENPSILPNVTLGFHIYDSYNNAQMTYHSTLNLLFKSNKFVPNYTCGIPKKIIGVIGALSPKTSLLMAQILSINKIPQLTYGSFPPSEDAMKQPSSFYYMATNEKPLYVGIIGLLKHFGWTWIGLFVVDDDGGSHFLETMEPLFSQNGICSEFTGRIPSYDQVHDEVGQNLVVANTYQIFQWSTSRIWVIYGSTLSFLWLKSVLVQGAPGENENPFLGKVWVLSEQTEFALLSYAQGSKMHLFPTTISYMIHSRQLDEFQEFLQSMKPDWKEVDDFLKGFWEQAFDCSAPVLGLPYKISKACTGEEKLEDLPWSFFDMHMSGHSYAIYNGIHAIAWAIHAFYTSRSNFRANKNVDLQDIQPWQEPLGKGLALLTLSFALVTIWVLGIFIKHKETAMVKANNRELTYVLLISLLLCFLSSLLFLGKPGKLSCLFRQPLFGIIFSIAVSSVLAKTLTVVLAFMATKPDFDMHSVAEKIILQCNEGSAAMFYLVLGYIGVLSIVSLNVAFLARKLPDSFNEAKLITFSMLIFCSVWSSFVPTYLSTKGKDVVAVEIFSILASSAGLLICIFPFKCYIIIVKPELNRRNQLIKRKT
ncbi:hypothetical protein JRQ81_004375 [Phrynocephalus forsythii]|uniref:G-protein coupled receptors family 3 profile domain-containing protein n=1 Tax=Phrynocephalus forsythii TaxID=171643 RepID=A0A9Q0XID8_9SAUR|nr:hypothetical protein JRQ81_004375 [Phrynocephalus forsythii]